MLQAASINIRKKFGAICSNFQRRNGFKNARYYPASVSCENKSDITKHPLNSKPIPQIDSMDYLSLIGRLFSVRIRCQTFSVVMGEPDRIFWYLLLDYWVQCLNRNRALIVPDTAPIGIEFGAVKAGCLN